ncbi:hypothetical protein BJF77_12020 [Kocuria sp. CNJ-770]|uniref:WhiB family transcriptional regulator n=1 Tax=Kocuria sp. CNJ-770 TaxID=1904964 RepID=UPI0009662631|nr:WhiB family transcriptional regulator [Kocuria sp. CNJ-770]OLT08685.1 hypothetical protein BJF77_12020 [Kocuria sp. CNJ-770]
MTTLDEAHGRLLAHIEDRQHSGVEIPCRGPDSAAWIAEDRQQQDFAVDQCHRCPVLEQCAEYALTYQEPAGTWGGLTTARRMSLRRAQAAGRAAA